MRLNKILFLVFLVLYFIAGFSLLVTGSVAHQRASQYAEITGHSIMSVAGFIIALGVIIIILSALGFIGAYTNRLGLLQIFIGSLLLILLLELIAVIVGFTLRNKADANLRTKLTGSLRSYTSGNSDAVTEWNRLQQEWSCCGVDDASDWVKLAGLPKPPDSCCINNDCPKTSDNTTSYYNQGCYESARLLFYRYSKALGGVSLFFFFIEIIGLVSAIVLLRDLKNNYGSV